MNLSRANSIVFNDQSLWEIEKEFIVGPKEDPATKFEENGLLQTFESEFSESCVAPYKNSAKEFAKFNFDGLHAQESLEPPCSSIQSLPSDLHDSLLKEKL